MKIKFGAIVTDGRGKIGGHVASKNRSGAYMRTKVTPSNPNTSAQVSARSLLASLSQSWRTLTKGQRLAWNNAVGDWSKTDIFGDIKNPTGLNLYIKLNANLLGVGLVAITTPPLKQDVPSAYAVSANYTISTGELTVYMNDESGDGIIGLIRATPPLSAGISFVKSELRVLGYASGTADVVSVTNLYASKFGVPVVAANVIVSVQWVLSNGQKSIPMQVKVDVVA